MVQQSCLVLIEAAGRKRSRAYILDVPHDSSAEALLESIRDRYTEGSSKYKRFFRKWCLLREPSVSVATLRQITVKNLSAMPSYNVLVQTAVRDGALTDALLNPASTDRAFYQHMLALYENVFVEINQHRDGGITLPAQALLIREQVDPKLKRVLGGVISVAGGVAMVIVNILGSN